MDGIIFTESFSFRNWTVSPTPPSKKKSILDEFPSSQWLLFMTTAFLSSSICFACGQIQLLHEFNILDSTNPYLSVCFIHHAICQCMYSYSMGLRIFWKLRGFIFNILKGQRSMTIFGKGRIFYQTCFKVISKLINKCRVNTISIFWETILKSCNINFTKIYYLEQSSLFINFEISINNYSPLDRI